MQHYNGTKDPAHNDCDRREYWVLRTNLGPVGVWNLGNDVYRLVRPSPRDTELRRYALRQLRKAVTP